MIRTHGRSTVPTCTSNTTTPDTRRPRPHGLEKAERRFRIDPDPIDDNEGKDIEQQSRVTSEEG